MARTTSEKTHTPTDVDALYAVPLSEFSAARNALATQLRKSGHADEADRVKALVKPSISAWAVNQLYWKHREAFERLIETGTRYRNAQALQLAGKSVDVRKPSEERREALSDLSQRATVLLRDAGHSTTLDTMRRVSATLEALSVLSSLPGAPAAGRLSADVDPPGFEVLAGLIPNTGKAERASGQTPMKRQAENMLGQARARAQEADAALKSAVAYAAEAEKHKQEAEQRLERARAMSEDAARRAREMAAEAEEAAKAVEAAARTVENANKT